MHSKFIKSHKPVAAVYRRAAEIIAGGQSFYSCHAIEDATYERFANTFSDPRNFWDLQELYVAQYQAMFGTKSVAANALKTISGDPFKDYGVVYVKNEKHVRHPYWNDERRPLKNQRVMALLMMATICEAGG